MVSDAQFALWCRQANERCVLAQVDYMHQVGSGSDATPTLGTLYFSNLGYVDESTTPPQAYDDALLEVPVFERALDQSTLRGAVQISLSGPLVLNNAGGDYDFLLNLAIDGSETRIYVGDPSWEFADFRHLYTVLNAKASAPKASQLEISVSDIGLLLNKSIGGTVAVGGTGPNADKFRPLCFGYVHNLEPELEDASTFKYDYNDRGTNASVPVVRSNGAVLAGAGTDYTDNGDGTFSLTGDPQSDQVTCDVLVYKDVGGSPPDTTNYRISDAVEFFVGGEAGLTALGKFAGPHPTYFNGSAANALNDYHCGVAFSDKKNIVDWLNADDGAMSTANAFWGQYRTGEFYYGRMRPEALSAIIGLSGGDIVVEDSLGIDDALKDSLALDHRLPTYVGYQSVANVNQTKQTTFAGTLTADERAMLSRDGLVSATFLGEDDGSTAYLGETASWLGGAPQLYDLSLSNSQVITTLISGASDTDVPDPATGFSIADMQAAFNSVRRSQFLPWTEFVDFTTFLEHYTLEIGDIVSFTYPRFDLDGGELHQVYKVSIDPMRARVDLGIVRRRFAAVTGGVPPFDFLAKEDGDLILQENGDDIIISVSGGSASSSVLLESGSHLLQLNGGRLLLLQ